ncbi:hypothetical protein [Selenomonas sp. AE3005]|uniref:hypothetical protein n=1 Tax=Selenomonas sp. AE3005 TaxID=1485543 RepID=UPI0025F60BCE|nr:hypothetical protein [Selenomonas sp. AE3005]
MGSKRYIGMLALCLLVIMGLSIKVNASSLDKYRAIMAGKSYTFKCYTYTPNLKGMRIQYGLSENDYMSETMIEESEKISREAQNEIDSVDFKMPCDIIVMDGETRYTEMTGKCKLLKNGEVFTYIHNSINDTYIGGHISKRGYVHMNEIAPGENNWPTRGYDNKLSTKADIEDVGNDLLMKMLAVIYPVSSANVELPNYSYIASGMAKDGSFYEDYAGTMNGMKHVVRCYFREGNLVKMGYASYPQNGVRSKENMEKYIIEIVEFTNVPEQKYLTLPTSLKVVRE